MKGDHMEELMLKIYEYLAQYGLNILAALVIFLIGKWIAQLAAGLAEKLMKKSNVDPTFASFIKEILYFLILAFVIIAALNRLGVQTASLVAIIGAAGLAVGLALQGSLANFAAGVLLIVLKPFRVGEFVEVAGVAGTVKEIRIFNTLLNAPDNKCILVPNAKITDGNIINYSREPQRRVDLVFSISYSDNMKTAKETLMKVVMAHPKVLKDPAPVVAVLELGESSVNLVCRPWASPQDYWQVYFDITEQGKLELEKNGITIPFPQQDVHLYKQDS